jgi:endonuclease III
MPTTTNKQRVLTHLFTALKKRATPPLEEHSVLEQLLYAVCRQGTTREQADLAFRALRERFFDWNEVRVSSPREIEEVFADMPNAEARAQRLVSLLQEVFETTFSFDLEILHKKGLKQAAKQLSRFEGANDYAVAWVIQQSLGGHAVPLDDQSIRVLRRLGLLDTDQEDLEALRGTVEHLVPKARAALFNDLLSIVADEFCWDESPNCPACPLRHECPAAQENRRPTVTAERGSRPKPR